MEVQVIDLEGTEYGPFKTAQEAAEFAKSRWPDQEQDEERVGNGWDVELVRYLAR